MSSAFLALPRTELLGLPMMSWFAIVVIAIFAVAIRGTRTGRAFYAAGGNPTAAVYTGIDVGRTQFIAFCVSGAVAGFCGYLWATRFSIANVDMANGFELDVIASCVIGGVSISGGIGTVAGAVLGATFFGVVRNALRSSTSRRSGSSRFPALRSLPRSSSTPAARNGPAPDPQRGGRVMNAEAPAARAIPDRIGGSAWWKRWEVILLAVAMAIFVYNSFASPYFLNPFNLSDATFNFTEKAPIAFAMAFLIIAGEIDLSVASIIAISSTAMGAAAAAGAGPPVLVVIGLAVGVLAGAFNGFIVTYFRLPSIVVTIGTMSLFRGIAYVVLGDQVYRTYPPGFDFFGQGYVFWSSRLSSCCFSFWQSSSPSCCT